jgi:hypothetical protein
MSIRRKLTTIVVSLFGLTGLLVACTPAEQYTFFVTLGDDVVSAEPTTLEEAGRQLAEARASWTPETATPAQNAVLTELARQAQERAFYEGLIRAERERQALDCYGAMRQIWPAHLHSWASGIIRRESGGQATAQNPSSSAAGCWQLLKMHDHRYYAVGCTPAQKYQAWCNNLAAYHLYKAAGTSPWRLTNY